MGMAIRMTLVLFVLTGGVFPAVITAIGQVVFPEQSNGTLVRDSAGRVRGSLLLAQQFREERFFHPRPSAVGYDAMGSGGANLAVASSKLLHGLQGDDGSYSFQGLEQLVAQYRTTNSVDSQTRIPADAVSRSGSGLDPHISIENARLQVNRVAKARGMNASDVEQLITRLSESPFLFIFGEKRVNVLRLNLALEALS